MMSKEWIVIIHIKVEEKQISKLSYSFRSIDWILDAIDLDQIYNSFQVILEFNPAWDLKKQWKFHIDALVPCLL